MKNSSMAQHTTNIHSGSGENKEAQESAQAHLLKITPQQGCPKTSNINYNFYLNHFKSEVKDAGCKNELDNFPQF